MAIDTTPSTVATNALQAIPFSSLIGGPLNACIEAQAQAANTTWEFINNVGLYEDKETGEKKAVTVNFQYQKDGQMVNLILPILTIVPIPYIAIDEINIEFIANISASSSSVTEVTESTEMGGEASVSASLGWGPFSVSADFKANYSSKKDSKSASESKYSVEYTMNVSVHAGQSDMPAGLATVLNILQSAISEAKPGGSVTSSQKSLLLRPADLNKGVSTVLTARMGNDLACDGLMISSLLEAKDSAPSPETLFDVIEVLRGEPEGTVSASTADADADDSGQVELMFSLKEGATFPEEDSVYYLTSSADIPPADPSKSSVNKAVKTTITVAGVPA